MELLVLGQTSLKQIEGAFVTSRFKIASTEKVHDINVVHLGLLDLLQERGVQVKSGNQVLEGLFIVFGGQVTFAELGVRFN